ncbi:hypothetical protein [Sulfuriferula plumbiphila]|uniref:hypothetical protein n=1 Tax=Sulfuriferula plumbiphila TaxID=171865 RepID=UPI0013874883|nr:hypothetical protein [Sulfuriferula plumbiphila]
MGAIAVAALTTGFLATTFFAAGFAAAFAAGFAAAFASGFFAAGLAAVLLAAAFVTGFAAAFFTAGLAAGFFATGLTGAFAFAAGFAAAFFTTGFATALLAAGLAAIFFTAGFVAALTAAFAAGLAAAFFATGFAAALAGAAFLAAGLVLLFAVVAITISPLKVKQLSCHFVQSFANALPRRWASTIYPALNSRKKHCKGLMIALLRLVPLILEQIFFKCAIWGADFENIFCEYCIESKQYRFATIWVRCVPAQTNVRLVRVRGSESCLVP